MLFTSLTFFLFFFVFFCSYHYLPGISCKRYTLLAGSLIFYGWWNWYFTFLLVAVGCLTWYGGVLLQRHANAAPQKQKWILATLIITVLLPLLLSKYYVFSLQIITDCIHFMKLSIPVPQIPAKWILPLGISFFTFMSIGYLVDVYRKKCQCEKNFITVLLFICFFPTVLSGPINRAKDLMPQLQTPKRATWEQAERGIALILWGFFLKIVLADNLSEGVLGVYGQWETCCGASLLFAIFLYSFQILCDFSGYSYMAIGVASLLGFSVMDNFHQPYFSKGFVDFWRRWHISLSLWLRDCVYISLGGNRCSTIRKYGNVMITFFVSGLWHGANWNFIFWGLLHGIAQVIDSIIQKIFQKMQWERWGKLIKAPFQIISIGITFLFVSYCWVFFSNSSLTKAWGICKKSLALNISDITSLKFMKVVRPSLMLDDYRAAEEVARGCHYYIYPILFLFVLVETIEYFKPGVFYKLPKFVRMASYWLLFAVIIIFGKYGPQSDAADFIYFQF